MLSFTASFLLTQGHEDCHVTFKNKETEAQTGLIVYPPLEVKNQAKLRDDDRSQNQGRAVRACAGMGVWWVLILTWVGYTGARPVKPHQAE